MLTWQNIPGIFHGSFQKGVENDDLHYIRPRKWDLVISPAGLAPFGHRRIISNKEVDARR